MKTIQIKDKKFALSIDEQSILKEVTRVANEINHDLKDENPVFVSVLNGSFMFTSDLMKQITIPSKVTFVKLASYEGVASYRGYKKRLWDFQKIFREELSL